MAKRYPAQIGSWRNEPSGHGSPAELLNLVQNIIEKTLKLCKSPGILLSGGVDSSLLAILCNQIQKVPCFTIGSSIDHPDVQAAARLAQECGFDHHIFVPSPETQALAEKSIPNCFPGDPGVYLALDFAAHFVKEILATDGIDEQMGGYWWHINRNTQFPTAEEAFTHFWNKLEPEHLAPMFESAQKAGLDLHWVYLHEEVVKFIKNIPLEERVSGGIGKAFWRETARLAGVPEWVLTRPKKGFVHALSRDC